VFAPYTSIKTNLLFFTKGTPTQDIWFYEHPLPAGVKAYNKTKPMKVQEFEALAQWWGSETDGFSTRVEHEYAWKVSLADIQGRNYNLDCKNPHVGEQITHDPELLLAQYQTMQQDISQLRSQLRTILAEALTSSIQG
jgi:type I restriction enzyme M protein